MKTRRLRLVAALAIALIALGAVAGFWAGGALAQRAEGVADVRVVPAEAAADAAADPLILSYAAKFVCLEPLQPGQLWYGTTAPILEEKTEVLIHNPQPYTVTVYKKAVRAPLEDTPEIAPGAWKRLDIKPDYAWRINCDDIAQLLTGNLAATFIGTYGIGVKVEGFVVIGVGPQVATGAPIRFGSVDVTAEYNKGSEVLKKDISYQPWWWWWWWPLPWRLGYAYQRVLTIDPATNIDCRNTLYSALNQDAQAIADTQQRTLTLAALDAGRTTDPTKIITANDPPALVAMIGRCDKITTTAASVDYVLLSNKGPTNQDPRGGGTVIAYPWIPGHWYDLTVVMPQNVNKDLDAYFRQWQTQRWIDTGVPAATVQAAMVYYFPWWCGWGYWWWWWNGDDCIDIAVGEGESIDVEPIAPTRVFMPVWPPQ